MKYTKVEAERAIKFVRHIELHHEVQTANDPVAHCKICGTSIEDMKEIKK